MWFVQYEMADGSGETQRWEGLTQEQAMDIYRQYSGWQGFDGPGAPRKNTIYCKAGQMQ